MQTCGSSFVAAAGPIVRFILKHTFAERFEPFSVLVHSQPRGLRQRLCCARSALRPGRVSQHLSVTHEGFFARSSCKNVSRVQFLRSARTHVPQTFVSMTPCHLHSRLQEVTVVHPHQRLGKQPGLVPFFAHMKVVHWECSTCRVAPARQGRQCSQAQQSEGTRWPEQNHEPPKANPAVLGSWEELGTRAAADHRPLLHLGASKIQTGQPPGSVPLMSSVGDADLVYPPLRRGSRRVSYSNPAWAERGQDSKGEDGRKTGDVGERDRVEECPVASAATCET